jgi:hypothetical protein
MFSNASSARKIAEQFAAQQRARDIATKGYSDIQLKQAKPKARTSAQLAKEDDTTSRTSTGSCDTGGIINSNGWREKQEETMNIAIDKIIDAKEKKKAERDEIVKKITYHVAKAKARLSHSNNRLGTIVF